MKGILLVTLLVTGSFFGYAQRIENITLISTEEGIELSFDIEHKESIQELYNVQIFASHDGYKLPIQPIGGKMTDLRTTDRLRFVIDGEEIFAGYKGEIDFKIKATMIYSPIIMHKPYGGAKYKKGSLVEISWKGGVENDTYKLDLYKGTKKVKTLESDISLHSYSWVASDTKKGNYKLKIASMNNESNSAFSPEIKIKSKMPVIIKLLPLFAIGAGAYFYLNQPEETPSGGGTVTNTDLPAPPGPPTN
jgi:hypothetical protein